MTAGEVRAAQEGKQHFCISVWDHKTSASQGSARLGVQPRVHQLLLRYIDGSESSDLVFKTSSGEKVTHIGLELEKLAEGFGKKFAITPTQNRKMIATVVGKTGTEQDEKDAAAHMSHSLDMHRSAYQHLKGGAEESIARFVNKLSVPV